jgi:U3 small nucleolar RNA-associated protein 22
VYGDSLLVFYDVHGGSVIGLLWNPAKSQPRSLKSFLGYTAKPARSEVSSFASRYGPKADVKAALIEIDRLSILGEISRMGQGLITKIDAK